MSKKKYYAVKAGKTPGIYQTWNQAEEQVKGFSGAIYKAFQTLEEAECFMSSDSYKIIDEDTSVEKLNNEILLKRENLTNNQVFAFVDGSYTQDSQGKEKYGFGAILVTKDAEVSLFKAVVNSEYMDSHNVAGEIEGVKQSILWAIENEKKEITIYYDYEGIEKWATKKWKATMKLTISYTKFYEEKSLLISIKFVHVKAHSGVTFNERADALARLSLLAQGYKTHNDGSVYFTGFSEENWYKLIDEIALDTKEFDNEYPIQRETEEKKEYLKSIRVRHGKDSLTINYYNGNKSYVQGKQTALFQKLIAYAIEKLPNEYSVIETLNAFHALTIDEISVENLVSQLLPNFPKNISDTKHYNNILSGVYNTMLVGYMPEYTCLIQPIFRGTEYYLHRILHDELGKKTERDDGTNYFAYFDKDDITLKYSYNSKTNGLNIDQINLLNEIYNFYNHIRHPYSHWAQNSVDTKVITSMKDARDYILEGFNLFDKYYIMF